MEYPKSPVQVVWLGNNPAESDLGVPVNSNKLNVSQRCNTAATKANQTLGCIHRGITGRDTDRIIPLSSPCIRLVPTKPERCRQRKGPKEGQNDDQREKTEGVGLCTLEKRKLRTYLITIS